MHILFYSIISCLLFYLFYSLFCSILSSLLYSILYILCYILFSILFCKVMSITMEEAHYKKQNSPNTSLCSVVLSAVDLLRCLRSLLHSDKRRESNSSETHRAAAEAPSSEGERHELREQVRGSPPAEVPLKFPAERERERSRSGPRLQDTQSSGARSSSPPRVTTSDPALSHSNRTRQCWFYPGMDWVSFRLKTESLYGTPG